MSSKRNSKMEIKIMNTEKNENNCTVCGGSGVNKSNIQDLNSMNERAGIQYQPIECQHCKGSGKEPK